MSPADFAAVMGTGNNRGYGGGWGGFGDGQGWWVLLLFLFAMNGGWGNRGGYGGGNGGGFGDVGAVPYMMTEATQQAVQRGFDQQGIQSGINSLNQTVANGFADAAVANCQGNANITAAITNGQYATAQAITGAKDTINGTLYANQLANNQTMNQLAMNLQNCCCENRAGLADLKYTVATENCADRQAVSDGLRDVIANQTANTQALINSQTQGFQAIQDKLCQLELDGVRQQLDNERRENVALQNRLQMANLAASQNAQTAAIIQDNNAQTANLIRAINPAPVPSYNVPNPYTGCCGQGYYGCGCNG